MATVSPLLNYTTTVSVDKTIGQIQKLLVSAGATNVATDYRRVDDTHLPVGIVFTVNTEYGFRKFSLPVNLTSVQAVLTRQRVQPKFRSVEQAARVAWRIVKDWVEAQLAIIETEMVTLDQVMLPYMQDDSGETVYGLYRGQQLAALERG